MHINVYIQIYILIYIYIHIHIHIYIYIYIYIYYTYIYLLTHDCAPADPLCTHAPAAIRAATDSPRPSVGYQAQLIILKSQLYSHIIQETQQQADF